MVPKICREASGKPKGKLTKKPKRNADRKANREAQRKTKMKAEAKAKGSPHEGVQDEPIRPLAELNLIKQ